MDVAYDQIQEEALSPQDGDAQNPFGQDSSKADDSLTAEQKNEKPRAMSSDLNSEFREAYQTIASTVWGAKLGGLWGTVRKQGESYYSTAARELSTASREASKASNSSSADLINHSTPPAIHQAQFPSTSTTSETTSKDTTTTPDPTPSTDPSATPKPTLKQPDSLSADIALEASSMLSQLRLNASSRLKQLQKAEDAADEALLQFGSNVRDFFRDAVTISSPSADAAASKGETLFESTAAPGSSTRAIHATRTDAHLHVLHTNPSSFTSAQSTTSNPAYPAWKESSGFDVEKKTDDIARDLARYPDLRGMMERLVPGELAYGEFWARYYFLRHVIEAEEKRRRELLAKSLEDEEVGWDDDDEDEDDAVRGQAGTPKQRPVRPGSGNDSASGGLLKPSEPRRSHEGQSVADSDASYDIVSQGVASRGPGSPKEDATRKRVDLGKDDSDEEDWE